ncbi:MAG: hypothetical protein KGQ42_08515 [Alphaproteobacteria bacterium]|nr:hypothetical protein [Alphaproteobacteria bacterium]
MPRQLVLKRLRQRGGTAGFLDLAVKFLQLPLQADFQIVRPSIELVGLDLEEAGITFGYVAADVRLLIGQRLVERGCYRIGLGSRSGDTAGEANAKSAASTWCGFISTCAPATATANLSLLSDDRRRTRSLAKYFE